jgi:hemerythrin superfamily protein
MEKISTNSKNEKSKNVKISTKEKNETESQDVIDLIMEDHKLLKQLILILKNPEVSFTKKLPAFEQFEVSLITHAKSEEESLYVSMKKLKELKVEGLEGDVEHSLADQLVNEIKETSDDDTWMAKVKVLAELVDHHIKEEESEMLKKVRKEFSKEKREEIGKNYSQLYTRYSEENDSPSLNEQAS